MKVSYIENPQNSAFSSERIYYEKRDFVANTVPFSFHNDVATRETQHYVHKHREIEILVPFEGYGQTVSDLRSLPMGVGDVVVVNSNHVHYSLSDHRVDYHCLIVDSEFLLANGIDTSSLFFEEHFRDPEIVSLIERLNDEWQNDKPYRASVLRALLTEIMVLLCRRHTINDTKALKESRTLLKIKQSIGYIKNYYRRDLSLDEIANTVGLSKYHFCREFKKATDLTPIEFINRTRCEVAKDLLETKPYSVSAVSEMCGFSTPAHFSKTFRGFFGIYPSECNKRGRESGGGEKT
ncbi:MAG: helix-turn-helix transcriptional regulator [Clostridia bacterium]|nr:helix-turn-helix transcriptional regulator [Clostridia bacterium]